MSSNHTIRQATWSAGRECWARRGLYLKVLLLAVVLACGVCASIPDEYYAETVITDENEGMDVLIGLNSITATIRQSRPKNQGIEDANVYTQLLQSRSFANNIATIYIPPYKLRYQQYLEQCHRLPWWETIYGKAASLLGDTTTDMPAAILDNIRLRTVARTGRISIQVRDQDPVVAAMLTDSIMARLGQHLLAVRQEKARADMVQAGKGRQEAKEAYMQAQRRYAQFIDSHFDVASAKDKTELSFLEKEVDARLKAYNTANIEYARAEALVERAVPPFNTVARATVPLRPFRPIRAAYIWAFLFMGFALTTWYVLWRKQKAAPAPRDFGDIFAPWSVTLGVWAIILLLYYVAGDLVTPLEPHFYVSLGLWIPILCLSAFTTYMLLPSRDDVGRTCGESIEVNKLLFNGLFMVIVVLSPLYLYQIWKIISQFDTQNLLYNIRLYNVNGDTSFGILNYAHILSQTALIIAIWHYPRMPLWQLILIFVANFICFAATMGKTSIFVIFVSLAFVLYEKGIIRLRSIAVGAVGILVLLFFFNLAREEQTSHASTGSNTTFLDFFLMYVMSPPAAFSTLQDHFSEQFGYSSLSAIYRLINDWTGSQYMVNPGIQEYAWVPVPTNVYTILQPFYEDFGYHGVAFFALVYGLVTGWLYRLCRNGSGVGKCVYTYFLVHLVMQFFMEDILLSFVAVSEFAIVVVACTQTTIRLSFIQQVPSNA